MLLAMRCERGSLLNVHSRDNAAARCFRPRPAQSSFSYRPRTLVICAKKNSSVYNSAAGPTRDLKKKTSKTTPRQKYVEGTEQPGASGVGAKVVQTVEEAPPPPPPVPVVEKEEVVSVPATEQPLSLPSMSPWVQTAAIAASVAVAAGLLAFGVRSLLGMRKPKEPMITVAQMEATFAERKEKMEQEFTEVLAEQIEQQNVEYREKLVEEVGRKEAEYDARTATREREVRKAHEEKFQADLKNETDVLKQQLETEKETLKADLQKEFEEEKSKVEMEWMKKVEEKEKEQQQSSHATAEAEELINELKSSQEHLKEHETLLETQLKEYETLVETLKASHATELEGTITSYKTEIRDLKEQIRYQEIEIERKKKEKEEQEEEERIRANSAVPEMAQGNGHLTEEASANQAIAVKTKPAPESEQEAPYVAPETLPLHYNGQESSTQEILQAEIRMMVAGTVIPHVDKVLTGGEDAFFVTSGSYGAIGVADGVGSWGTDGVNPSFYARELMAAARDYIDATPLEELSAKHAIAHAHEVAKSPGSATMCVAMVQPDGVLEIANIGDCGVRVIRGTKCIFSTQPMSHEFNMPYQLANPQILPETDWPEDADVYSFELQEKDVVVMGSDGLFDNMWDDDLARLVNNFAGELQPTDEQTAQVISKRLADVAHYNAKQKKIRSPWAVHAADSGNMPLLKRMFPTGGKMDDCTVVVGFANRCA